MAYGLSVTNNSNQVQIDNTYANYYLIDSGQATTGYSTTGSVYWQINNNSSVTVNFTNPTGQYPLLFIQHVPFSGMGYISGTVLTITSVNAGSGQLGRGALLSKNTTPSVLDGTAITTLGTGTGGVGTYNVGRSQTVGSAGSPVAISTGTSENYWVTFSAKLTSTTSFKCLCRTSVFLNLSSPSYIINDPITVGTFNWRIYVPQSTITQSTIQTGYGLNVYKTDGTVAFTSNRAAQLMRVRGIFPAKGYWDEVNNMPYGSGAGDVRFKSAFENNLGATGTRQQYPFVQMNATTSSLAGYFDGSGYSNSYSIMVGGKTNAAGNTIVHSVLSDGTFDAGTGDVATYGLSTPCQLLPANYTYNSSTGILKYTPIFSWMGQLRDFQVGVPFTFTTGFNAQGFPYVTNVLVANSVTRTSGTTNNIDLNIGTGLTIDPANPSVTSWSNVSTFRRSAREPLSNYYGPGNTLQTNIVNTFGTTTMVLDE